MPKTTLTSAAGLAVGLMAAGLSGLVPAAPAHAQSMDYGALEDLFGEPVTTSATGKPQRVTDAPVNMLIITAEDIRRSAAIDIPEVLRRFGGMNVMRNTLGQADVSVRGYNQPYSPRLLVLLDGRQVYLDHFAMTAWQNLPVQLSEIRQIEVIKGPNAALFGFNAVGGVINIVTYNPLHDQVTFAEATLGTQEHVGGSGAVSARLGDHTGVRLSLGAFKAREFETEVNPDFAEYRQDPENKNVRLVSVSQLGDRRHLTLEGSFARTDETGYLPFPGYSTSRFKTWSAKAGYSADTGLGLIDATVYHNVFEGFVNCRMAGWVPLDNQVTVAKLQDLFKVGTDHTARVAAEYRHNTITNTPSVSDGETGYEVYSGSVMWDWQITESLAWNNAARVDVMDVFRNGSTHPNAIYSNDDYNNRRIWGVSYNSGAVYKATDHDTFRLSTGRGLQAPSLIELGFHMNSPDAGGPGVDLFTSGNPNIRPTVVTNYEIGYDRALPQIQGKGRFGVFYQTNRDLKSLPPDAPPMQRQFDNVGDSDMWGFGMGVSAERSDGLRWGANYVHLQVSDRLSVDPSRYPVRFEDSVPAHTLNANLGYSTGPWEMDLYGQLTSGYGVLETILVNGQPQRHHKDIAAGLMVSGRVAYALNERTTISAVGVGLNRAEHAVSAAPKAERRIFLRLSTRY